MTRQRVVSQLRKTAERVVRNLVRDIQRTLVEDTPKDTQFASVNWVPKVGSAFEGTAGTRAQAEQGQLDRATAQAGLREAAGFTLPDGEVHITNNVDYIELLNAGSSSQAPAAFVQAAIVKSIQNSGARRSE